MSEQFMKQAEGFMQAAKDVRVPENFQVMAEEGVARTRDAYEKMSAAAKDTNGAMEKLTGVASEGARKLGDQAFANMSANTEAAFDAAEAVVRAESLPEAAKLQADFMQQQMAVATEQTKHFFELSSKVAKEAAEHMTAMTTNAVEKAKA